MRAIARPRLVVPLHALSSVQTRAIAIGTDIVRTYINPDVAIIATESTVANASFRAVVTAGLGIQMTFAVRTAAVRDITARFLSVGGRNEAGNEKEEEGRGFDVVHVLINQ